MDYVSLGSTDDIGASCHLLMVEGTGLMLDAGVHPDVDGPEGLPRLGLIQSRPDLWVDHVLVSHAHHDHLGALPVVLCRCSRIGRDAKLSFWRSTPVLSPDFSQR